MAQTVSRPSALQALSSEFIPQYNKNKWTTTTKKKKPENATLKIAIQEKRSWILSNKWNYIL
jgi:hypothetical protein